MAAVAALAALPQTVLVVVAEAPCQQGLDLLVVNLMIMLPVILGNSEAPMPLLVQRERLVDMAAVQVGVASSLLYMMAAAAIVEVRAAAAVAG